MCSSFCCSFSRELDQVRVPATVASTPSSTVASTPASTPAPTPAPQGGGSPLVADVPPTVASSPTFPETFWPDASLSVTSQSEEYTATELFDLATDSQTNSNAKARLIAVIQTTPNKHLQKIFHISSMCQVRSLTTEQSKGMLRVLLYGKFHLRQEFRTRMNQDAPTKRWLVASKAGNIFIGKRVEDMHGRIVALLEIQH